MSYVVQCFVFLLWCNHIETPSFINCAIYNSLQMLVTAKIIVVE